MTLSIQGKKNVRTNTLAIALLLCVTSPAKSYAQAAQGAGPTLAETMGFINEKLQQRGSVSFGDLRINSENFSGATCEQTLRRSYRQSLESVEEQFTSFATLRLDEADVSSVAIREADKSDSGTTFAVDVNKIAYSSQYAVHPQPTGEIGPGEVVGTYWRGTVQSVDAASVTFLPPGSGRALRLGLDKSPKFSLKDTGKPSKAKLSDIHPGDELLVDAPDSFEKHYYVVITKKPGGIAPVLPDPEVILPATRQVGPERKKFEFGYSKDRSDAESLAKAMIHAIVLCQANAKKDLF